jgi:carboxypeptidase C (cathepsin A)
MRVRMLLGIAASLLTVGPLSAQQRGGGGGGRGGAPGAPTTGGRGATAVADNVPAVEKISTTQHTMTIGGKQIAYTARAGTMVLNGADGKPRATVFYISYTRDGMDAATRPVTFFYNGGPGSASVWLSMGVMGPKHPEMAPEGMQPAPPYHLIDNADSPLDVTDLVQIDAMMTGYSRPGEGVNASEFTGAPEDITMFGEFIRDYLDKYNRWSSPKYLFGESYGTFRSAGLASELQTNEGVELNGIMLLGTVLNFQYIQQSSDNDIGYSTYLPTYTATAWFHKKLPADLQRMTLEQVVQESRNYAFGDYMTALAKGNALTPAERTAVAQKLSRLTGASVSYIMNSNLRINAGSYRTELLRDTHQTLGRYDSRMTGINGDPGATREDYDPSDVAPAGAFMASFMSYLHNDLNYDNPLQYYTGGHTGRWDYSMFENRYASEIEPLRTAMAKDPYLHVLVGAGYYDMATPFANAEYTFTHLGFDKTYADRVKFNYYPSGHMVYLNQTALKMLKRNIADFIQSTERGGTASVTP